jgi:hypothetical protein
MKMRLDISPRLSFPFASFLICSAMLAACSGSDDSLNLGTNSTSSGSSGSTGSGSSGSTSSGSSGSTSSGAIVCDDKLPIAYAPSGLPLLQTNPGAPVVLFVDYDGGTHFSSSNGETVYSGYNRNGSPDSFDAEEQADIIKSIERVGHYYAMFDVNVTSDESVRKAAQAWGWIIITEEESGGSGSLSLKAIGQEPYARSYCGASSVRIEDSDKSRRVAHELGHNFTLEHSGVWEGGNFYKWEDWPNWDQVYGPIMGGGGLGKRNGWAYGQHEGDPNTLQDEMEVIRTRIMDVSTSATGWRIDDFADDKAAPLCDGGNGTAYRRGILGSPTDTDLFDLAWPGGNIKLTAMAVDVSAALPIVEVLQNEMVIGEGTTVTNLPAGNYRLRIRSNGEYGAIGSYEVSVIP